MADKIAIPESLKSDLPHNQWGKVLAMTPVVMTVIATLLAGLSSGEMIRAQYDRSLAAQQQSKAGDQWSYFQAKRLRAALQRSTLDLIRSSGVVHPLDSAALAFGAVGSSNPATEKTAWESLSHATLPSLPSTPPSDERITAALEAVDAGRPDPEIARLLVSIKPADLAAALDAASAHVRAFDVAIKPVLSAIDGLEAQYTRASSAGTFDPATRDFIAARLTVAALRYDAESRQNQFIAQLLELQVRQSNISAEHHHTRSQRFFYGMLLAQMAVIVSTFSLARQRRSFLWAFAATAGLAAIAFASYVYLFV